MCVTLLCIHVPTSTSIIITIITINICLKSNTIFQFSSPRFCPFWLRNMYKMSNSTTISSACELWLEARSAKYISPHDTKRDLRDLQMTRIRVRHWLRLRESIKINENHLDVTCWCFVYFQDYFESSMLKSMPSHFYIWTVHLWH